MMDTQRPSWAQAFKGTVMRENWDGRGMEDGGREESGRGSDKWAVIQEEDVKERSEKRCYFWKTLVYVTKEKIYPRSKLSWFTQTQLNPASPLHCHFWSGTSSSVWPSGVPSWSGKVNTSGYRLSPQQTSSLKGALQQIIKIYLHNAGVWSSWENNPSHVSSLD